MKYILLLLIVVACNPQRQAFKQAEKHYARIQELVKKYPSIMDSLKLIRYDTVVTAAVSDSLNINNDPSSWDSSFWGNEVLPVIHEIDSAKRREPVKKLQQLVCPTATKDSTYMLKVYNSEFTLWIPIKLSIKASGSKLAINIAARPIRVPERKEKIVTQFINPKRRYYQDVWFWVAVIMMLITLLSLFKSR